MVSIEYGVERCGGDKVALIAFLLLTAQATPAFAQAEIKTAQAATVRVDATPGHAINTFDPDSALGSSIDVLSRTDINKVYTPLSSRRRSRPAGDRSPTAI